MASSTPDHTPPSQPDLEPLEPARQTGFFLAIVDAEGAVPENLQRLIDERGWSRRRLARELQDANLDHPPSTTRVNDFFTGRRGPITWLDILALVGVLECTVFDLVLPTKLRGQALQSWFGLRDDDLESALERERNAAPVAWERIMTEAMLRQHPLYVTTGRVLDNRRKAWIRANDPTTVWHAEQDLEASLSDIELALSTGVDNGSIPDPRSHMEDLYPSMPGIDDRRHGRGYEVASVLEFDPEWRRRVRERWLEVEPDWEGTDDVD